MKPIIFIFPFIFLFSISHAQHILNGRVISAETGMPIANATITLSQNDALALTNPNGSFIISAKVMPDTLTVTMLGYVAKAVLVSGASENHVIALSPSETAIEEVQVSTGYYTVPRERATGSFTVIDNDLLNRSASTDIISRLEGVTNGLQFERTNIRNESKQSPKLRVRGIGTIHSDESPLIVVDNFPYDGDIAEINPNDVEYITILKDAAAASIWGARAGNGVIVITTKKGKYGQPAQISLKSNVNILERPDLFYSQNFIPSEEWMEVEQFLFDRGFFGEEDDLAPLPPYVELLIKQRDGQIGRTDFESQKNDLESNDIRRNASDYLYRTAVNLQHSLNIRGGSEKYKYYLSGGYDRNLDKVVGDEYARLSLSLNNTVQLHPQIELSLNAYYSSTNNTNNGVTLTSLSANPYVLLKDDEGNHLPIPANYRMPYVEHAEAIGLLDWEYRPLDEPTLSDNRNDYVRTRFDASLRYRVLLGLSAEVRYQYQVGNRETRIINGKDSYYVRNLVNRFTQENGTQIIPHGDILRESNSAHRGHYGRVQLNFRNDFGERAEISALGGIEIRNDVNTGNPGYLLYGYNSEVLTYANVFNYTMMYPTKPNGTRQRIPANTGTFTHITDRNLSYYANASYTYLDRYILSISGRWDGSNLFGVRTNQKGVPLWSFGGSWNLSDEQFFRKNVFQNLRLRVTYGVNGNVNRNVSALPSIRLSTNSINELSVATLTSAGDPNLRWEKINSFNIALDFRTANNRIGGSVEYFNKKAKDLIGEKYIDPTSGLGRVRNMVNYASMGSSGWDLEVSSVNTKGRINWMTTIIVNYAKNKITNYDKEDVFSWTSHIISGRVPVVGESIDMIYSLPWIGLDNKTGVPLVGEGDIDYASFLNNLKFDDIVHSGLAIPPYYGSVQNTIDYEGLSIGFNITWKAGYSFRRNSVNYNRMFNASEMHTDFLRRWRKPGDEKHTSVPALPTDVDNHRDNIYLYGEQLIENGNHIRLQEVQLSYKFDKLFVSSKVPIQDVRLTLYANNLGIIWRKNNSGIDPDMAYALYPMPSSLAVGFQVHF